jgi:hypothetical protein
MINHILNGLNRPRNWKDSGIKLEATWRVPAGTQAEHRFNHNDSTVLSERSTPLFGQVLADGVKSLTVRNEHSGVNANLPTAGNLILQGRLPSRLVQEVEMRRLPEKAPSRSCASNSTHCAALSQISLTPK